MGADLGYNWNMAPKITPEMRTALSQSKGQPIEVEDQESNRVYWLFESPLAEMLLDQQVLQEFLTWRLSRKSDDKHDQLDRWIIARLEEAEAEVAAGLATSWDIDDFRKKLQARLSQTSSS
ncbi:MAG: hypothetical protein KF708_02840 [Pirellulales bacterium]|nr:hypothetical protein [Pirellulales bacterium]